MILSASLLGVDGIYTSSGETTQNSFQLISGNKIVGILFAYDVDDETKYCSAVVCVGSNGADYLLNVIAKNEVGLTIGGGYWGYIVFGGVTEGHRINYKFRKLI